ncbi:pyruvate kinase [Butyrivibrio sp. CB08]|uniref:pyruvate kinase n=1 Tax=Butyrivibrio sp. CB08 TaxID=2364879 RepID=UPI000EAA3D86|nr:pyruvate kinase [Butyrivibrio sp. CB08]RKM62259.1 pyruvate kinase [Butyrivibrio sp. CB08]
MIDIFGTLGPKCDNEIMLKEMFLRGMTGIRINLSHVKLFDCKDSIDRIKQAAKEAGTTPKILIDMQGPELRVGDFDGVVSLAKGYYQTLGDEWIPVDEKIIRAMEPGDEILLDDGKILAQVKEVKGTTAEIYVKRSGGLTGKKSIRIVGKEVPMPALTDEDIENLKFASEYGITGIMQPFVRNRDDLLAVRNQLQISGCPDLRIYAKVESMEGVENLENYINDCDEIIIARGDLGNAMPLWELPGVQKRIAKTCREHNKPFMVVTQMLSSMEKSAVPTRAEVSDIYNAVLDGATSVMVTGETAIGEYPHEVIKYLVNTANEADKKIKQNKTGE